MAFCSTMSSVKYVNIASTCTKEQCTKSHAVKVASSGSFFTQNMKSNMNIKVSSVCFLPKHDMIIAGTNHGHVIFASNDSDRMLPQKKILDCCSLHSLIETVNQTCQSVP